MSTTPLGYIIRPVSGARLPVLEFGIDGTIVVQGAYVAFETTIRAAVRSGYRLEEPTMELLEAWERFCFGHTSALTVLLDHDRRRT